MSGFEARSLAATSADVLISMDDRQQEQGQRVLQDEPVVTSHPPQPALGARRVTKICGIPRWTLGIFLLMVTVVMWTASNFLASYIFADDTFSKPYFVTFANTTVFAVSLIPLMAKQMHDGTRDKLLLKIRAAWKARRNRGSKTLAEGDQSPLMADDEDIHGSTHGLVDSRRLILVDDSMHSSQSLDVKSSKNGQDAISFQETVKLSIEFCSLWFAANYFAAGCLQYTTVASATILTSTSSIWTLLLGALAGVEKFTFKKLIGVLASLAGIVLISTVDLSGTTDENRGSFPHKSTKELAIGDAMAFFSAILYGFYTVLMKKRIGDESRVNVLLFFALVGFANIVLLWPGFIILHFTGVETFEIPPSGRVWIVIISNSLASFFSDLTWAFAMLFTSPLVVTVGLGLTIPLSLIGQMILASQYSSAAYWIGAGIVLLSFIFINHESTGAEQEAVEGDLPLSVTNTGSSPSSGRSSGDVVRAREVGRAGDGMVVGNVGDLGELGQLEGGEEGRVPLVDVTLVSDR